MSFKIELTQLIKTQVAEYRHKPLLNLGFIFSLAIATSTLLSILILNHASKQEYQQANAKLSSPISYTVMAKERGNLSIEDFANLRKQGFTELMPILSFSKTLSSGQRISFKGIDLLGLSIAQPDHYNINQVMLNAEYAKKLSLSTEQPLTFTREKKAKNSLNNNGGNDLKNNNSDTKPFDNFSTNLLIKMINNQGLGNIAIIDINTAWQIFDDVTGFSYLIVNEITETKLAQLEDVLPAHLVLQQSWSLDERSGFADALHLNLMALAILAFVVSLFIAFQAANQAWHNRSELMSKLRLLGVALFSIRFALAIEAIFLILVASLIGVVIAVLLVSALLPILGLTLNQLYNLNTSGYLAWNWQYFIWSVFITSVAVFIALVKQYFIINNQKISFFAKQIKTNTSDTLFFKQATGFALVATFSFFIWPEADWHHIMVKYALLLFVGLSLLPLFLLIALKGLNQLVQQFRLKFILQDTVNQITRRFLPLAAFYIALTTSIAAALMVNSFESAFVKYLDQNLSEDLYVRFNQGKKSELANWLAKNDNVDEYYLYYQALAKVDWLDTESTELQLKTQIKQQDTIGITTVKSQRQFDAIVFKSLPNELISVEKRFDSRDNAAKIAIEQFSSNACFINEQLALKRNVVLNDKINISQNSGKFNCTVSGIYFDYGNPSFEVTLFTEFAVKEIRNLTELGFGVFLKDDDDANSEINLADVKQRLLDEVAIEDNQVFAPESIKKMALKLFSQTFLLTQAIAAILLSIACFGLFLSANNLELARKEDLFVLVSLGYSRLALFTHMLTQWLLLACGCILLSWPVALLIAQSLVTKVLPSSFGWSMPLVLDLTSFSSSSLIGLLCLIPALFMPLRTLTSRKKLGKI